MIYEIASTKPMEQIQHGLEESAIRHKFGIIAMHDLQETLKKKGLELAIECRVFEVCNPGQAKKVLDANGAVSTALPCRISVYGSPGDYKLATLRPSEMMKAFGDPRLEPVAKEVEDVIIAMMEEAAI